MYQNSKFECEKKLKEVIMRFRLNTRTDSPDLNM